MNTRKVQSMGGGLLLTVAVLLSACGGRSDPVGDNSALPEEPGANACAAAPGGFRVAGLQAEAQTNPLGIDDPRPRFTWRMESERRCVSQSAYELRVGSAAGRSDIWTSGKVSTADAFADYDGPALASRKRYHWSVKVYDQAGKGISGDEAWFETAFLDPSEWSAQWIGREVPAVGKNATGADPRTSQLRKEFDLPRTVRSARVYATALGSYQLEVNGTPVGDDRLAPGWTDYRDRVQYQTYDVTPLVRKGANAIGAVLSTGWYAGKISNVGKNTYGSAVPGLKLQLEITYSDGSSERIVSDPSWRTIQGPVIGADQQDGEYYDARLETPGWSAPGFDAGAWEPVILKADLPAGATRLSAQRDEPVRKTQELQPLTITRLSADAQIVDLGQNMVGVVRLVMRKLPAGTDIRLRFAEALNPDGSLYLTNLRSAQVTDHYIAKGAAEEVWEPKFTFHGFRYVEVTNYPGDLSPGQVTGVVLGTDLPVTGQFESSNALLNQLFSNVTWSQRGNFLSVPTDCPQRDERMGWTGDINVFAPTAAFNMDVRRFLGDKWMTDVRDTQSTLSGAIGIVVPEPIGQGFEPDGPFGLDLLWTSAAVRVPHTVWQAYGDTKVIDENWDMMKRYMDHWELLEPVGVFGDWAAPAPNPNDAVIPIPLTTPTAPIAMAWFKHDADMMAAMAEATGRSEDAAHYRALSDTYKGYFNLLFVQPGGNVGLPLLQNQATYALALAFGMLPDDLRPLAAAKLEGLARNAGDGWDLTTGFLGTPELLGALSDHGQLEAAYTLLMQTDYPSWLYEVEQGATTTWEFWNVITPDGTPNAQASNSLNHYALGAVSSWMVRNIGGLSLDSGSPGYANTVIRPRPGADITHASASFDSIRGLIRTSWRKAGDGFDLEVQVPANGTATLYFPHDDPQGISEVAEGRVVQADRATGVKLIGVKAGETVYRLHSGTYRFRSGSAEPLPGNGGSEQRFGGAMSPSLLPLLLLFAIARRRRRLAVHR